jgi:hypothetical protein
VTAHAFATDDARELSSLARTAARPAIFRRAMVRSMQATARLQGHGIKLAGRPGKRPRGDYPWATWQDGTWCVIRQGRDFNCTINGMRSTLFTRAKRDDIAVEVIRNPEAPEIPPSAQRLHLAFCFYPGRSYADGPPKTS